MLPVLAGPTAVGKSALALAVARRTGARILCIDSMLVYRGMDIGTDKPSRQDRADVPHDGIDIRDPGETFSAALFLQEAGRALEGASRRGDRVLAVCGTPLYLRAYRDGLFEGPGADEGVRAELAAVARVSGSGALHDRLARVDAAAARRIHPNDERRIIRALEVVERSGRPISEQQAQWGAGGARPVSLLVLDRPRDVLCRRIDARIDRMMERGLVEEVRRLSGTPLARGPRQAIGYKEILEHLEGRATLAEAVERIRRATRHLAKQQRTWLRSLGAWATWDLGEGDSDTVAEVARATAWAMEAWGVGGESG